MRTSFALVALAELTISGCSTPTHGLERTFEVIVLVDGSRCGLRIGSSDVWDLSSGPAHAELTRLLPQNNRPIRLTNTVSTPFRCVGAAVYEMQRLGHRKVGFVSEPTPSVPPGGQH